jgi:hypothetical protein
MAESRWDSKLLDESARYSDLDLSFAGASTATVPNAERRPAVMILNCLLPLALSRTNTVGR